MSKKRVKEDRSDWVAVEGDFQNKNEVKIEKAKSAFGWYQKDMTSKINEEMKSIAREEGVTLELGMVQKELSSRWKSLPAAEKKIFEDKAADDRERYNNECRLRDEEVENERKRKREEREAVVEGKRDRKSNVSFAPKKRVAREQSQEQKEAKKKREEIRRQEREGRDELKAEENRQKDELKEKKASAAAARLQYLLSQSDIFEHFGKDLKAKKKGAAAAAAAGSPRKRLSEREEDESMMHEKHDAVRLTKQPSLIKFGTMRGYQLEGLNWMVNLSNRGINGILADEMGLGKTLQTISVLAYTKEFLNVDGPHIVLVPKSTLSNWLNEFKRWCPCLRTVKFHGNKDERQSIIDNILCPGTPDSQRKFDVCVTTFEMCIREKNALTKFAWRYLVIDEAHRIKNEASLFSTTVRALETEHRLLLTGTPLQNNLHELWALLNFLLPDIFSSSEQFDEWFNLDVDDDEAKKKMIHQLHRILRPFMLRRLKADVEKSLPPKKETLLFVGMSAMQKALYKSLLLRDMDAVTGASSGRTALLNIVMQLRKCCGHPYLFEGQEDRALDPMGEHLIDNCGKLVLLDKLMKKLKERGSRVLIFSQMTRVLDILEDFCRMRSHDYCRIDGQTSYEEREDSIDVFNQENSPKFCFLLSTRAGGLGINLYTADIVILFDSDWNPQADLQAQDRAHRIGQKKEVNVYRLVTSNSIEEKVVERAQQKLKLDAMVVQQGRLQEKNSKLSKDEMREMIRFGADKVFRSTESEVTDDDIDAILAQGAARTAEMNEKLTSVDKGDLLDFKLDGGSNVQHHDGIDYSNQKNRQDELKRMAEAELALAMSAGMGKRERKPVMNYSLTYRRKSDKKKRNLLPKALRLPRMDDWHFFDRERIVELHEMEVASYEASKEMEEPPTQFLSDDLLEEKRELIAEGFSGWNKQHFNTFVKLLSRYGRKNLTEIAAEMGREEEDVRRYAAVFWKKGEDALNDWDKIVKNIEKGESKLLEIQELKKQTKKKVERYSLPFDYMPISYQGKQGKLYTEEEDRALLCLVHRHGYGAWDKIKRDICQQERFLFDYYIRSRTATEIGRRCDTLMRTCEKDNADHEDKENRDKEIRTRLCEERAKVDNELKHVRKELESHQSKVDALILNEAKKMQENRKFKRVWADRLSYEKKAEMMFDEEALDCFVGPLLRFLHQCTLKDSAKAALKFVEDFTMLPVTAVSKKIKEIADMIKKDPKSENQIRWKVKPEFQSRVEEPEGTPLPQHKHVRHVESATTTSSATKSKTPNSGSKRLPKSPWSPSASKQPVKKKRRSSAKSASKAGSGKRAKGEGKDGQVSIKPPKKPRSAYVLYSLAFRSEVKASLPPDADIVNLMAKLTEMWKGLTDDERRPWDDKAIEDRKRYEVEKSKFDEMSKAASEATA